MPLPSKAQAIERVRELADREDVVLSRKADRQKDNLGYTTPDVCDMLYSVEEEDVEKLESSHWCADVPVLVMQVPFTKEGSDVEDELFVEVAINSDHLYVLACKLYGSPQ
jgi:hypothetical protein